MAAIVALITLKEKQVESLREQIKRLKEIALLEASGEVGAVAQEQPPMLYMCQVILREARKPLHAAEMARIAREKHGWIVKASSMGTQLHKSVSTAKHGIFVKSKDAKNTYALKDWGAEPRDLRNRPGART